MNDGNRDGSLDYNLTPWGVDRGIVPSTEPNISLTARSRHRYVVPVHTKGIYLFVENLKPNKV